MFSLGDGVVIILGGVITALVALWVTTALIDNREEAMKKKGK